MEERDKENFYKATRDLERIARGERAKADTPKEWRSWNYLSLRLWQARKEIGKMRGGK